MLRDADIREPLFDFLEETYGKVRILEEKTIGRSRADVVMIAESAIYGLEIKSDVDSYARLAGQIRDYDKFYDYNYVVIGTTHAIHIREHVPEYWGIITVEEVGEDIDFYILRKTLPNPNVNLKRSMSILWRREIAVIQLENNMPKYKDKSKDYVIDKIIERTQLPENHKNRIALEMLKKQISDVLFERDYANISSVLIEYRKGEFQKKIEAEENIARKEELIAELEGKRRQAVKNGFKKRKRRRYMRIWRQVAGLSGSFNTIKLCRKEGGINGYLQFY